MGVDGRKASVYTYRMAERTELFNVRMSTDERTMLARLADSDGMTSADVVRMLVRREHAARFGTASKPAKRARKAG